MRPALAAAAFLLLCACRTTTTNTNTKINKTPGLVLLLRQPLALTATTTAAQLQQEFDRPFPVLAPDHSGPDPRDFVAADPPRLQIAVDRDVFRLTSLNRPYVEDVYRWPFIQPHQAWLAIDSVSPNPSTQTERTLARILSRLATQDPVAIYLPAADRMVPAPPGLPQLPRSPRPIGLLFPEN